MNKVTIKKGIPIPDNIRRGRPREHPFDKMQVADYARLNASYKSAHSCMRLFIKNHEPGWVFVLKKVDDNHTDCWRTQ